MKKIVIMALCLMLLALRTNAQIGWSNLANNQAVSWADLQNAVSTGVFAWGGTAFPTAATNQCLYKNLATVSNYAAVTLNTGRANNDLLLKSDFTSSATNQINAYGYYSSPNFRGWATSGNACDSGKTSSSTLLINYSGTLSSGSRVKTSAPVNSLPSFPYYYYSSGWLQIAQDANGYYIASLGTCGGKILVNTSYTINYNIQPASGITISIYSSSGTLATTILSNASSAVVGNYLSSGAYYIVISTSQGTAYYSVCDATGHSVASGSTTTSNRVPDDVVTLIDDGLQIYVGSSSYSILQCAN